MPRVTAAHRQARRDEIVDAAIRVLRRTGVSGASIAQIVEESGLSAGAVYANFENKAELARHVARSLLDWRVGELDQATADGMVRSPATVMRFLLSTMDQEAPVPLILQFWGEATVDPDLHAVLSTTVTALRDAFERAIRPWAATQAPDDVDRLVRRTAVAMIVMCQGFLANTALLGWTSFDDYLATATSMLGT